MAKQNARSGILRAAGDECNKKGCKLTHKSKTKKTQKRIFGKKPEERSNENNETKGPKRKMNKTESDKRNSRQQ